MRQNEQRLSLYINVTPGICLMCLAYYHQFEYFETAGNDMKISDDKMTVTKLDLENSGWHNTAYGKAWIDSTIHQIVEWKFKINAMHSQYSIYF